MPVRCSSDTYSGYLIFLSFLGVYGNKMMCANDQMICATCLFVRICRWHVLHPHFTYMWCPWINLRKKYPFLCRQMCIFMWTRYVVQMYCIYQTIPHLQFGKNYLRVNFSFLPYFLPSVFPSFRISFHPSFLPAPSWLWFVQIKVLSGSWESFDSPPVLDRWNGAFMVTLTTN